MTLHKAMLATSLSLRDRLIEDMNDTQTYMRESQAKRVNYLSIEYLLGRLLHHILINVDLEDKYDDDKDAALGNGGLGRLAACYMDSLATMNIHGEGGVRG